MKPAQGGRGGSWRGRGEELEMRNPGMDGDALCTEAHHLLASSLSERDEDLGGKRKSGVGVGEGEALGRGVPRDSATPG